MEFAFFGTGEIAVGVLNELEKAGRKPALIISSLDAPKGRGLELSAPPAKKWALERNIEVVQPARLKKEDAVSLAERAFSVAIVVDYGMLVPQSVIDAFPRGILNMHPSLLPKLRGPSPIRTALLRDIRDTGVTIMLLDAQLDHGPIIAQKKISPEKWPFKGRDLDAMLSREGGALLATILPHWVTGDVEPHEQNHDIATYSEEIKKSDAEINLNEDAYQNLLKICAYDGWPWAFTYFKRGDKKLRVIITDAHIEHGKLVIDRVKPEGKQEMSYADFSRSGAVPA